MVIVPGAEEFGRFVYAVYLSVRRGIREFQLFVKTREAVDLIGDVAKLAPEELATLKSSYLEAIKEMEAVAAHGKALAMTDDETRAFMNLRGQTKGMKVEELKGHMDAWKVTKESGVPFGFESAEHFERFRATASAELTKALKKTDPKAEAFLQGSSISGISYKRHLPFDVESDFDIAVASRYLFRKAETLGYEVSLSPRRIGPLTAEQIRELGLEKFQIRLGEVTVLATETTTATTPRTVNILLFQDSDAVTKPIGAASRETKRAAIPLKAR